MAKHSFTTNPDFASDMRGKIFRIAIICLALVYIGRLAHLQIVQGSIYRSVSEAQAIKEEIVEPFRGIIYDRNGKLLVHNEPSYTISITPKEFVRSPAALNLLSSIIDVDTSVIMRMLDPYLSKDRHRPQKLFKDISFDMVAKIEEFHEFLPGVAVVVESKRLYNFDVHMAHLLGYTREISRDDLEKIRQKAIDDLKKSKEPYTSRQIDEKAYYRRGDIIGISGLERSYENELRGSKGIRFIMVNPLGEKTNNYNNGENDSLVRNGFDMYLTIDKDLQIRAEKKFDEKNYRGAIVAMDPRNGEILCFASKPDYDLTLLSGKVSQEVYSSLSNDPGKPLYSRALQSGYPPGSTWKMLVALAGLQEGLIDTRSTIVCGGSFQFGNRSFGCHGAHGAVNVIRAIQASCNVFFYKLALRIGLQKLTEYAEMFGFGKTTGIDLPNERKGFFPTYDWVKKKFGQGSVQGRLVNYGIGQGEILVTPLQMAQYVSALANKGTIYQPHVVKYYYNNITSRYDSLTFSHREIPIDKRYFDIVQKGMFDVVNTPGGTAYGIRDAQVAICGKTGTAQNPQGKDHSWFICYAPADNPVIAVACIVENAGFGSTVAAPIAAEIIRAYLFPNSPSLTPTQENAVTEQFTNSDH